MRNLKEDSADYKFRIEVSSYKGTRVVFKRDLESELGLIEAHWSPAGDQLSMLVCDMLGPPAVWVNYDLTHDQVMSPSSIQPIIEKQLRLKYSLTDNRDVLRWACSNQGVSAYRELAKRGAVK